MTIIQSPKLVHRIFNLLICSLVINIAKLFSKAVLLDILIPKPGFIRPIVELPTVETLPTRISVIINNIFFLFKLLYFFLYYSLSILRDFNIIS